MVPFSPLMEDYLDRLQSLQVHCMPIWLKDMFSQVLPQLPWMQTATLPPHIPSEKFSFGDCCDTKSPGTWRVCLSLNSFPRMESNLGKAGFYLTQYKDQTGWLK